MIWLLGACCAVLYLYRRSRNEREYERTHLSNGWLKELSEGRKRAVIVQPEPMLYQEERRQR